MAEKRRLAPGWLDREEKILEPERGGGAREGGEGDGEGGGEGDGDGSLLDRRDGGEEEEVGGRRSLMGERVREGEELDRAFGGMGLR